MLPCCFPSHQASYLLPSLLAKPPFNTYGAKDGFTCIGFHENQIRSGDGKKKRFELNSLPPAVRCSTHSLPLPLMSKHRDTVLIMGPDPYLGEAVNFFFFLQYFSIPAPIRGGEAAVTKIQKNVPRSDHRKAFSVFLRMKSFYYLSECF